MGPLLTGVCPHLPPWGHVFCFDPKMFVPWEPAVGMDVCQDGGPVVGRRRLGYNEPLNTTIERGRCQPMEPDGSVTRWIAPLQGGDPTAVEQLWQRYFSRLVGLARQRLDGRRGGWPTRRTWRCPPSRVFAATPSAAVSRS